MEVKTLKERRDLSLTLTSHRVEELINQFLIAQDISPTTKKNYRKYLKRFFAWVRTKGIMPSELTRERIIQYRNELSRELSPDSVNSYLVAVRNFFKFVSSKTNFPDIAKDVKSFRVKKGFKRDALTNEQIRNLLNSIDTKTIKGLRDKALINLTIFTGLRRIELSRINIEDIRQEGEERLLYIQGKGHSEKDEFVVITDSEIYQPIADYLQARGEIKNTDPLFVSHSNRSRGKRLTPRSISRIVKNHLRDIGINSPRLSCHSLRHTALTLSLKAGASLEEAQRLGRHKSINTTLIYLHHIDRIKQAPEKKIVQYLKRNFVPNGSLGVKTDIEIADKNLEKGGVIYAHQN